MCANDIDFPTLKQYAQAAGWEVNLVSDESDGHYLCLLKKMQVSTVTDAYSACPNPTQPTEKILEASAPKTKYAMLHDWTVSSRKRESSPATRPILGRLCPRQCSPSVH